VPRHVGISAIRRRAIRKTAIVAASVTSAETVERASATTALFGCAAPSAHRDALPKVSSTSTLHPAAAIAAAALLLVCLFRFLHGIAERHSGFFNRHDVLQPRRHLAFAFTASERRRRKSPGATRCRFERH